MEEDLSEKILLKIIFSGEKLTDFFMTWVTTATPITLKKFFISEVTLFFNFYSQVLINSISK
jgi:hypothetical protein